MSRDALQGSKLAIAGAYLFLFILVLWPFVDLITTAWPMRIGDIQWRYGFLGLMTAYAHTPILAMLLGVALAILLRNRKTLRVISVACLLWALALLVILILFPLDVIQLRAATPEENRAVFQTGAIISELKHMTALLVLALLGLGGWRTAGGWARSARSTEGSELTAQVLKAQKLE